LAEAAIKAGCEVWIQSRNRDSLNAVGGVPVGRRIDGDLDGVGWHSRLEGDWDYAVNLVSSAGGGLEGYKRSYIEGNRSIREWAAGRRVGRFLYTSATSVYPQSDGRWVTEADVPEVEALSPSGALLRQSEEETLAADCFGSRIVARLAGIYGPGRHLYLNRLKDGAASIPGDGTAWLNLIHLKDIVTALMTLLECPRLDEAEVFNVVDDRPSRKQEIVDWLAAELGMEPIPFDPTLQGRRSSRRMSPAGLPNRRVRNERLKRMTGWAPAFRDFRAGYRDILGRS
jgi:nucleoside-diphosphate-sugar epimerase